ncbi:hypothetical protein K439DRAFT_1638770 [Ramaria rubella]|nr:hypothetical protein K439DRAFT_1638770 [Ramaria rubella]
MRFLAIVSVFFAVTQVAFAAPVFRFHSKVITRNLRPAQLQERGFPLPTGVKVVHEKAKNTLNTAHKKAKDTVMTAHQAATTQINSVATKVGTVVTTHTTKLATKAKKAATRLSNTVRPPKSPIPLNRPSGFHDLSNWKTFESEPSEPDKKAMTFANPEHIEEDPDEE